MSNRFPYGTQAPSKEPIKTLIREITDSFSVETKDEEVIVTLFERNSTDSDDKDNNIGSIIETLTAHDYSYTIAQEDTETKITVTQKLVDNFDEKTILQKVSNTLESALPEEDYVFTNQEEAITIQLHNDTKTDTITSKFAQDGLSFRLSKGFEVPPKIIVAKPPSGQ
jgi:hypothetical protein